VMAESGASLPSFDATVSAWISALPALKDGNDAPDSAITGSTGTARVKTTYDAITITNLSGEELDLNSISPANPDATGLVTLDAQSVSAQFDVADAAGPTDLTIVNEGGAAPSDVVINGLIDNPTGHTTILNSGGDIRDGASGILRSNDVTLRGDAIGSSGNRLDVELVRSAGRPTGMTVDATGDIYLDLTGRLRTTNLPDAVFATGALSAGGSIDLLLEPVVQETQPIGVVNGITFSVPQEPFSGTFLNHFRPDAGSATPLDPAIYADTSLAAPIAGSYDFGHLVAGGNIVVNAAHPGVSDTTVNVQANTAILGTGHLDVLTNGSIGIVETAGDLRVDVIRSNAGDVSLESADGSIYDVTTGSADDGATP